MTAIEGAGTSEECWLPFLAGLGLPELPMEPLPARVVVVAPHPDDEILGVGGLLRLLADRGVPIEVVAVTDGEASHPGGSRGSLELAAVRARESLAALEELRLAAPIQRLRLPDGGGAGLAAPVAAALAPGPSTWLLAPWREDGHPDHEAVGRGCATAAARDGARLLEYPVWAWHWDEPGVGALPWGRARQVPLPAAVRAAKGAAMAAFGSQTTAQGPLAADAPVLPEHVLARFRRPFEVVLA